MDPQTGQCVVATEGMIKFSEELVKAIKAARDGTFQPDRENDELTRALGNDEHIGRTRGAGDVPWKTGFSECSDSYRSRQRNKKQETDRLKKIENKNEELECRMMWQQEQLDAICQQRAPVLS